MCALEYPNVPSGSDEAIANNDVGFFMRFIIMKTRDSKHVCFYLGYDSSRLFHYNN